MTLNDKAKKKKTHPEFRRVRSGTLELARTMSSASLTAKDRKVQEEEINTFLDEIVDLRAEK